MGIPLAPLPPFHTSIRLLSLFSYLDFLNKPLIYVCHAINTPNPINTPSRNMFVCF